MTATQEATEHLIFQVEPERLNWGRWCHTANKAFSEGDIASSYSADRIAMNQPLRRVFSWQGSMWVCIGLRSLKGEPTAEAYRLVDPRAFAGVAMSYEEKTRDGDAARADPNGFYHGMTVSHAGKTFVLSGPRAQFEPGEVAQLSLFG